MGRSLIIEYTHTVMRRSLIIEYTHTVMRRSLNMNTPTLLWGGAST